MVAWSGEILAEHLVNQVTEFTHDNEISLIRYELGLQIALFWYILGCMNGSDLRKWAESMGLTPAEVSRAAGISDETLRKVYRNIHVKPTTRVKIENAISRLIEKAKVAEAV